MRYQTQGNDYLLDKSEGDATLNMSRARGANRLDTDVLRFHSFAQRILELIFSYFDSNMDIISCSLVCKSWSEAALSILSSSPRFDSSKSICRLIDRVMDNDSNGLKHLSIQTLNLSSESLEQVDIGDIDTLLQLSPHLKYITLNSNSVSNTLLRLISDTCVSLVSLKLPYASISDALIPTLLSSCQQLKSIDFSFTNVTITSLFHIIQMQTKIVSLQLSCLRSSELPLSLSTTLKPSHLKYLDLSHAYINMYYIIPLFIALTNLKHLNLSRTNANDVISLTISTSCPLLERLNLSQCPITDISMNAFHSLPMLRTLDISYCHTITPRAVNLLCTKNTHIHKIDMDGCSLIKYSYVAEYRYRKGVGLCLTGFGLKLLRNKSCVGESRGTQTGVDDKIDKVDSINEELKKYSPKSAEISRIPVLTPRKKREDVMR